VRLTGPFLRERSCQKQRTLAPCGEPCRPLTFVVAFAVREEETEEKEQRRHSEGKWKRVSGNGLCGEREREWAHLLEWHAEV